MASNSIPNIDDWRYRDDVKQMRKQKRNRDTDMLKPKGIIIRKKEERYRRKQKTTVRDIHVADISPRIDVYETNNEPGDTSVIYSRDFQKDPMMKDEQIVPEERTTPESVTLAPSTDWDELFDANQGVNEEVTPEPESVQEQVPEMPKLNEEQMVAIVQQTAKRSNRGRAVMYGILTTVVVVGAVFGYLRISKNGE